MSEQTELVMTAVEYAAAWLDMNGVQIPSDILMNLAAIKTEKFYARALNQLVTELYGGKIDAEQFVNQQADLITQQLRRAFNEGMRSNGLDPQTDMTPAWEKEYQDIVADEFNYVDRFAKDIAQAAKDGKPVDPFRSRVDKWATRYPDVVNQAKIITGDDNQPYTWHYGDTIEHCESCSEQANVTRTAKEWRALRERGIYPQSRQLACTGHYCDCRIDKG